MIIDLILDRKEYESENPGIKYADFLKWANSEQGKQAIETAHKNGGYICKPYHAKDFYIGVMRYGGYYADKITSVMDYGTEQETKNALIEYINGNNYSPDIIDYIKSVEWLTD